VINTFRHQACHLCAREEDRLVGILPLFRIKSRFWGHSLVSLPFAVYGGVCADNEQIEQALLKAAVKLGQELGADHLELRQLWQIKGELVNKDLYMTFALELAPDPELVWKAMRKRNRNILRKGIKSGLKLHRQPSWEGVDSQELKTFYKLFARTQTALGTPVLPWRWFLNLLSAFPQQIGLFSTQYQGKIINSLMVFRFKDSLLPYYIGYDPRYLQYAPNNFILWEAIQFGCRQGYQYFDLSRSRRGSGSYEFKRHWGIEPQPLYYQYHLYPGHEMPNLSPSNPKFELAKRVWCHLPLPLAKLISPGLVKYLG